ncbi:hypothetical protein SAMN04488503_1197 [Humidesulfovibrio mexicanus]|uniref:L,D-TPase catalytic domain-containing protein n=1 Tax=Humidesulfovibrio mexicanus TaxID=147047 RepID=A0A238Z2K6_9BACT|nr:L,D-transpeptidase family protein [Humidesulfovibrio mexicanus]SNR77617.1 hypothetical protein SAMN04488503_1197 [Humidesulfovibrio mexicanus]
MRSTTLFMCAGVLALALCLGAAGCAPRPACLGGEDLTNGSRQLLLVVAEDWSSTQAHLQRLERSGPDEDWRRVGAPVAVNLGRNGLGWGRGLHGLALGAGPVKREGDGRAPVGLFALGQGFAQEPEEVKEARVPVLRADERLYCVDDAASPLYNTFARADGGPKAWKSAEDMLRADGQYRLGVFVRHNSDPVTPGAGSCIFLHIWLGQGVASSGCTNMDAADMLTVLRWLDADKGPLLAQLPRADYDRLRSAWRLPLLP